MTRQHKTRLLAGFVLVEMGGIGPPSEIWLNGHLLS
ncbi:MAG: hypothetical protein UU84_C0049G0011 [Candidatus Yanofskybacteria bacterium GW2011_GWC2_41_9]|uniref:Uncharacterized protein n=1 Tax=Candidatus Yanofskybacteria bacterium GW2011_GWC2_41_9 TaxID=1619029 RepID=A0A0G0XJF8_9BACT|nr:MAG: hypothetical protein UU84_C0049G0011 [Candidatus Yanofskybacteria bacterium GW2011_GWC2_41_9]